MKNHDYYQINNLFILVPVCLSLFALGQNMAANLYASPWTKNGGWGMILGLVYRCDRKMNSGTAMMIGTTTSSMQNIAWYDIEPYLEELGIDRSARVHCTPDPSINISLYLCNRKGLTDFPRLLAACQWMRR